MPKSASPSQSAPLSWWEIYRAAKAKWIGSVEATDAHVAIEAAGKEFKVDASAADRSAAVTMCGGANDDVARLTGRDRV